MIPSDLIKVAVSDLLSIWMGEGRIPKCSRRSNGNLSFTISISSGLILQPRTRYQCARYAIIQIRYKVEALKNRNLSHSYDQILNSVLIFCLHEVSIGLNICLCFQTCNCYLYAVP